jgi:hypothetical protein
MYVYIYVYAYICTYTYINTCIRISYIKLLNNQFIGGYNVRASNHTGLLAALKEVNQMIQKAANLRVGKPKLSVIADCRAAGISICLYTDIFLNIYICIYTYIYILYICTFYFNISVKTNNMSALSRIIRYGYENGNSGNR